jgi:hypothetical protein
VTPWKVILAALVIFASGFATGVVVVKKLPPSEPAAQPVATTHSNPPAHSLWNQQQKELLHKLNKELALKPEQRSRIEKLLKESQERTKAIREKIGPEMKEEVKNLRDQIRAELSPEQQSKFEVAMKIKPRKDEKPDKSEKSEERRRKEPRDTNTLSDTNR